MDRTTLGRAILPLERDGLVAVSPDPADRRVRIIALTPAGAARHAEARTGWAQAQARYEAAVGAERAARLRAELNEVAAARF
jgi:DNA-binding MarR family transcriptional regulator